MTIYDLVTASELSTYWTEVVESLEPFIGEELFPNDKKLGIKLSWLKGADGLPIVLRPSAFDVASIPRPRIGITKMETEMPYFKESTYIDEELRQQLNMVLESNNQKYIDAIMNRIFDNEAELLKGARVQRERMRMMLLTSGLISMQGNGQIYDYDYQLPQGHKQNAIKDWSDPEADILEDIRKGKQKILDDTGVEITRAITTSKVMGYMRKNTVIRESINDATTANRWISDTKLKQFVLDELGITIAINDKVYADENEVRQRYVDDELFVMIPDGDLGSTWFGTTPAESDLMGSPNIANVSIVDTGVAITTIKKADPVQVETIVSMICLPDFPHGDKVYILSTKAQQ